MRRGMIPFFIPHQGCPHICVFCNQARIVGESRCVTQDDVRQTIAEYLADSDTDRAWEVCFYGGSFTAIPRSVQAALLAPATEALRAGCIQHIRCSTRPDCVDDETIAWLQEQGVDTVELGVQTMNDAMLRTSQRGHTADDVRDAVHRLRAAGMTVGVQLLPGLPGETWQTLVETAVAITSLQPDIARIYPVLVIADTTLADWYVDGTYEPLLLELAVRMCAFLKDWLTAHEITVIRTGLQATTELDSGSSYIAGPYAPAFGEMVVNQSYRWKIERVMTEHQEWFGAIREVEIAYPRRLTSAVCGLKRANRMGVAETYPDVAFTWKEREQIGVTVRVDGYTYVV